ncbi:hypothetical protein ACV229_30050 [Burkholderia sp. MR1-5-21]
MADVDSLLEFIPDHLGGNLWNWYDLGAATKHQVYGNPAVYTPADGGIPHIYVRGLIPLGREDNLLEFIPDTYYGRLWNAYDLTAATGQQVTGNPAVFTPADGGAPHIYIPGRDNPGTAAPNNLLEFIPDNMGGQLWNAWDLTAATGRQVLGDPAVYTPVGGGLQHIYILGTAENLLEFVPDDLGGQLWNAYDLTALTGQGVYGNPAVYTPVGGGPPHIYISGTAGNLLEFKPDPDNPGGWLAPDLTALTGQQVAGNPAVYTPVGGGVPHIYIGGTANNLLEFKPDPDNPGGWLARDVTALTGQQVAGNPAVYTPADGGEPHIYIRGTASNLLEFIPDNLGGQLWNAYDLTADTGGQLVTGDPAVYTPVGGGAQHVYIVWAPGGL